VAKPGGPPDVDALLDQLVRDRATNPYGHTSGVKLEEIRTGKRILALDREEQARVVAAALGRIRELERASEAVRSKASDATTRRCRAGATTTRSPCADS
jgi:hypothetical protein